MKNHSTAFTISLIIAPLAAITAAGGLLINGLYRDNAFVTTAWLANDTITLLVAVPLMVLSLWFVGKGSTRWQLVWMGMLAYMAYNYAFYLFGAAFNPFFVLYAALVALSVSALITGLGSLPVSVMAGQFSAKTPVKVLSIYIAFIALMLFMAEMSMIVNYLVTGALPETIKLTGHPTSVVFALDLSVVIPLSLVAAILLWKRHPWGYVTGMIMMLKGFTYGLVLTVGTIWLALSPAFGKWDPLLPFYVVLIIGGLTGNLILLKNYSCSKN